MTEHLKALKSLNDAAYKAIRTCPSKTRNDQLMDLIRISGEIDNIIDSL